MITTVATNVTPAVKSTVLRLNCFELTLRDTYRRNHRYTGRIDYSRDGVNFSSEEFVSNNINHVVSAMALWSKRKNEPISETDILVALVKHFGVPARKPLKYPGDLEVRSTVCPLTDFYRSVVYKKGAVVSSHYGASLDSTLRIAGVLIDKVYS